MPVVGLPEEFLPWSPPLLCWASPPARAHFLFIRIEPPAEAGRSAEVFFSEQAEAGDPKFVVKIAHTSFGSRLSQASFASCPQSRPPTG